MVAALAEGSSTIRGFSPAGDCRSTLSGLQALGVRITRARDAVVVAGRGPEGLRQPEGPVDCGRSGTTMRLLAGLVAGHAFGALLTGEEQLLARPMERVAEPLRMMGAAVDSAPFGRPPLTIRGGSLAGIEHRPEVASAQVKSAVLLAGVQALGRTRVLERVPTRDHTERILARAGAPVTVERLTAGGSAASVSRADLRAFEVDVPGDVSSAAPILAAAALVPGSDVAIEGVGLNPGRTGFLGVLARMGGDLQIDPHPGSGELSEESAGTVRLRFAPLGPVRLDARDIPGLVDEVPLVALLATQAEGVTEVRGAGELRVKESDRIAATVAGLRTLGADLEELSDGFVVRGPVRLTGGRCDSVRDHRLAMLFTLAGLVASGPVAVVGTEFIGDSFPGFRKLLGRVS